MGTQRYINTTSTHMQHGTADARSFVAIFRIRITSTLLKITWHYVWRMTLNITCSIWHMQF